MNNNFKNSNLSKNQNNNNSNKYFYLPSNHLLNSNYVIEDLIFCNSEGATYIANNKQFDKKYFIREFAPVNLSKRSSDDFRITPLLNKEAQYKALMIDFIDLYQVLSNMSSKGIIPILDVFQENNTVYIVKEYIDLISLTNYLSLCPNGSLSWYKCKSIFLKINSILSNIHHQGLIHRGICPNNIYFDKFKKIYIDGFSIACVRTAHSELTDELYEGYSAPEQFQTDGWQGTWTDVYGVATTLYRSLTGSTLSFNDSLNNKQNQSMMPQEVLNAIISATKFNYKERTKTIDEFNTQLLDEDFNSNTTIYDTSKLTNQNNYKNYYSNHRNKGDNKMKKTKISLIIIISSIILVFIIAGVNIIKILRNTSSTQKIDEKYIEKNSWLFDDSSANQTYVNEKLGKSSNKNTVTLSMKILPNFVGEQISNITNNKLYKSKLNFTTEEEFSESPKGEIIHQDPLPGVSLNKSNLNVILKVSKGPDYVEVPDIIGHPIEEAENILKSLEIKYEIFEVYDENYTKDVINFMDKKPGDKVIKNKDVLILRVKSSEIEEKPQSSSNSNNSIDDKKHSINNVHVPDSNQDDNSNLLEEQ